MKNITVALIAPSSPTKDANLVSNIKKVFSETNIELIVADSCLSNNGYLSCSDAQKVSEIEGYFKNPDVDLIMCLRGGYGSGRILDSLNYDLIKQNNKPFIGFSDVTVLINTLNIKSGIDTYHGPMGVNLPDIGNLNFVKEIFNNKKEFKFEEDITILNDNQMEGVVYGGNLIMINSLLSTPYEIDFRDKIILIEEIGEEPYKIDRLLNQLRLAGIFDIVSGIIFGSFTSCDNAEENQYYKDVLEQYTKDLTCPIIYDFPTGHGIIPFNLPIGKKVLITKNTLTIMENNE